MSVRWKTLPLIDETSASVLASASSSASAVHTTATAREPVASSWPDPVLSTAP